MISSVTAAIAGNNEGATGLGQLGTDLFLELLIAQMQNQNPLEPMDGAALMQQTSQLANVEAIQKMSELQTHVVGLSQFASATTMIGRTVQADDPILGPVEGVVTAVSTSPSGAVLRIGDRDISIDDVISVSASEAAPPTTTGETSSP